MSITIPADKIEQVNGLPCVKGTWYQWRGPLHWDKPTIQTKWIVKWETKQICLAKPEQIPDFFILETLPEQGQSVWLECEEVFNDATARYIHHYQLKLKNGKVIIIEDTTRPVDDEDEESHLPYSNEVLTNQAEEIADLKQLVKDKDARVEVLEDAIQKIAYDPYPEDIFTPLTKNEWQKIHSFLEKEKILIDRLSGEYGRILRRPLAKIAADALNSSTKE